MLSLCFKICLVHKRHAHQFPYIFFRSSMLFSKPIMLWWFLHSNSLLLLAVAAEAYELMQWV